MHNTFPLSDIFPNLNFSLYKTKKCTHILLGASFSRTLALFRFEQLLTDAVGTERVPTAGGEDCVAHEASTDRAGQGGRGEALLQQLSRFGLKFGFEATKFWVPLNSIDLFILLVYKFSFSRVEKPNLSGNNVYLPF